MTPGDEHVLAGTFLTSTSDSTSRPKTNSACEVSIIALYTDYRGIICFHVQSTPAFSKTHDAGKDPNLKIEIWKKNLVKSED